MVRIALDAMGGDHAPLAPVAGAVRAARQWGYEIQLVGREVEVRQALQQHGDLSGIAHPLHIVHAPDVSEMRHPPATAAAVSNGEEEGKGNATLAEAIPLIRALPINYVGNIEGKDVTAGAVDVVVVDGFAGNIFLKGAEGVVTTMSEMIRQELTRNPFRMLLAAGLRPAFRSIRRRLSYEEYGGVPLLGVNGVCIVAHGPSTPLGMQKAIRARARCVRLRLIA